MQKLEGKLIFFRSVRWIVYAQRYDKKTIYVELAARRDRRFGGHRNAQALLEPRIRGRVAAVPFPQLLGVLLRSGLVHIKKLRIESESFVGLCIIHGFDFEDRIAFVSSRSNWTRCRFKTFAYADLAV